MPFVNIQLKEGRTAEQKEDLAKKIVEYMTETNFASKDAIHVIFEDLKDGDYYPGNQMK